MAENDTDTLAVDDAQEQADFGAGFDGVEVKTDKRPAKADKSAPAETPRAEAKEDEPEFVQIKAKEWAEVRAAAAKTASYDQQLSKAFGTIGNLQKLVNGFQTQQGVQAAPPDGRKVVLDAAAFADMEKDFPELAQQVRAAMERALSGVPMGAADTEKLESLVAAARAKERAKEQIEDLEDVWPNWREIVGAVTKDEQPDPDHPFRKWLGTKDEDYQAKINGAESAAIIGRAIRLFQKETTAPAQPRMNGTPRDTARAARIAAAVQPRGDNAGAAAGKTDQDEFEAGFNSR